MESQGDDIAGSVRSGEALPYPFLRPLPRHGRGGTMQRVQDAIREAIVALALTPGEFIHKEALCKRLGEANRQAASTRFSWSLAGA